jgi:hypothetical protein
MLLAPLIEGDTLAGFDISQHVGAVFFLDSVGFEQKRQHFVLEPSGAGVADGPLGVAVHKHHQRGPVVGPHLKHFFFGALFQLQAEGGEVFGIGQARAVDPIADRAF